MKIKKRLVEAANNTEVLDNIDGAEDLSKAQETKLANEVNTALRTFDVDEDSIEGDLEPVTTNIEENNIIRTLNRALRSAKASQRRGNNFNSNVLIVGLPGSGKTAIIREWANNVKIGGKPVHMEYINMKNDDLDQYINGYTIHRAPKEGEDDFGEVGQAHAVNLDGLETENSIILLDEYNRQTNDKIRGSVLSLINEHYVAANRKHSDLGADGKPTGIHTFKNLLFTIAIMNPATNLDPGAAKINQAELTRYNAAYQLWDQDSDKEITEKYINRHYLTELNTVLSSEHPKRSDVEDILRTRDLGLYMLGDSRFKYQGSIDKTLSRQEKRLARAKQLTVLADLDENGYNLFNQRSFVELLNDSRGDAKYIKRKCEEDSLPYSDNVIMMLCDIINDYDVPTLNDLLLDSAVDEVFKKNNFANPAYVKNTSQTTPAPQAEEQPVVDTDKPLDDPDADLIDNDEYAKASISDLKAKTSAAVGNVMDRLRKNKK